MDKYSPVEAANMIEQLASYTKQSVNTMLEDCGLNKNMLQTMKSLGSMPQAGNLAKIADYMDCSVDYLLGRTDNPHALQPEKPTHPEPKRISSEELARRITHHLRKIRPRRVGRAGMYVIPPDPRAVCRHRRRPFGHFYRAAAPWPFSGQPGRAPR